MLFFTIIFLFIGSALGCVTHIQCPHCFECNQKNGSCVQTIPYTDPLNQCGIHCGVKMVCGQDPYCVHTVLPTCICDWTSGECAQPSTAPPPPTMATAATVAAMTRDFAEYSHMMLDACLFVSMVVMMVVYFRLSNNNSGVQTMVATAVTATNDVENPKSK